ncbi:MAG: Long-chain-fatty-acid--CoA ligase, partial [uncultured Gemmatimonadaceae bacterium]
GSEQRAPSPVRAVGRGTGDRGCERRRAAGPPGHPHATLLRRRRAVRPRGRVAVQGRRELAPDLPPRPRDARAPRRARPRGAGGRPGRPRGDHLGEPAGVGDRRLRLPHGARLGRAGVPEPPAGAGRVRAARLRRGGRVRLDGRAGGEGGGGAGRAAGAPPRDRLRRRAVRGRRPHARGARGAGRRARRRRRRRAPPRRGARGAPRRRRDDPLHVGHDGRAEGGDAHPRQPVLERAVAAHAHPVHGAGRGAQLPPAVAHLRAAHRPLPDVQHGHVDRVRGVDRHDRGEHGRGAADARRLGAARVREDLRPRARGGDLGERGQEADLLLGTRRGRPVGRRDARRPHPDGAARRAVRGGAEARLLEAQGARGRAHALLRLGRRAARRGDQQVLLRRRPHDSRGLRAHGDVAGDHVQRAGRRADRNGGRADPRRRGGDRRGRRDPHARAARDARLLQQARGHRRGHRRGRVAAHRRRGRAPRRVRGDHGPQEGHHRHRRRQEHRPAADREQSQDEPLREPGRDARRQAPLPVDAHRARLGPARAVGSGRGDRHDQPRRARRVAGGARQGGGRGAQGVRRLRELRGAEAGGAAGARVLDRPRRAHPQAERPASRRGPDVQGRDRRDVR